MSQEEVQKILEALKNSIEGFATQIESIATGVEKPKTVETVITTQLQGENKEQTARLNDDIGPSDVKFIDALYKKFQPLLEGLTPKASAPASETEDLESVLAGEETEKITKVSIVSISDEALKMLKGTSSAPAAEKGGGFLSGIMGFLGGAGATAVGGGLVALLTSLPAAIPGILTALGAIIGVAAALSLAIGIVVKTISYLKDDFVKIFPVVEQFAMLFLRVAKEIIPVIGAAITDFVKNVLPPLINAFTTFAAVVIPVVIKAISDLISSPGFKFIVGALATIVSQTIGVLGGLLTETIGGLKSLVSDVGNVLINLFDNVRMIVISVIGDIKDVIIAIAEPVKQTLIVAFEKLRDVTMIIVDGINEAIKRVFDTIDKFMDKAQQMFERVPDLINKTLNSIAEFANKITLGKIGAVALELGALTGALVALTAGSLINSIADFFTKSPFEKIIEFQNNLDPTKLKVLENLAPSLQKLIDIDVSQLKGVSSILNELVDQSLKVTSTVEKIFSGEGIFFKSGGILELVDKLEKAKEGAENTISAVLIKTSETQKQIAELQLKETVNTNKILSEIYKKMDAFAEVVVKGTTLALQPAVAQVDVTMPLQFTSTNTRQQIVQSGNSK